MDYTTVIGIDNSTLPQIRLTWPTWKKHKPSLLNHPMIVFHDRDVRPADVRDVVDHPNLDVVPWPPRSDVVYEGSGTTKWNSPQRAKMLAGFVYTSLSVTTPYWLKIDTDVVATGRDNWIDLSLFENFPVIVAPKWGYTKPAWQMLELDHWVDRNSSHSAFGRLVRNKPLNLVPELGSNKVIHRRICSWCAFFSTPFTQMCATVSSTSVGTCKLPVPSQDGFMWYVAKRGDYLIREMKPKALGWNVRNGLKNIQSFIEESK